jgi:hypothetical protein
MTESGRQAMALEDIADQITALVKAKRAKEEPGWTFTVHRDSDGFISTVTAKQDGDY